MFENWGFLLGEIWVLLLLAALIGLIAGWLIWGGRREAGTDAHGAEIRQLRADLDSCKSQCKDKDDLIGRLEARLEGRGGRAAVAESAPAAKTASVPAPAEAAGTAPATDFDKDGVDEGTNEGVKPMTLDAPRDGKVDNLKKIKGVGPKLEKLCNRLGFWHFDQIAAWTDDEVAWVNANLEGFKGRVTRDNWVEQAKVLATGGKTEFSERVEAGDVYDKDKS
ncbi:hypothetical protein [Methyloceanibacter sp.]|uniref:hypothetical protein n=1 Tax=Methyloceanibacter sp. TaxID=1965321 RepID=UPI002D005FA3|nr:hypothetical protein [Methyloceanibacter sp.]HML93622.1 hypothetical protein [Methyloceanibacter sp.]